MGLNRLLEGMTFGVEIECYGAGPAALGEAIAAATGGTSQGGGLSGGCVALPDGRRWEFVADGSIQATRRRPSTIEAISPICTYADIEMVQAVVRAIHGAGWRVNQSCGLHVHVGLLDFTPAIMRALLGTWARWEDNFLFAAGTAAGGRSRWATKIPPGVVAAARRLAAESTLDEAASAWYGHTITGAVVADGADKYSDTRYRSLNLHSIFIRGTVEFRLWNATLHAGKVRAAVVASMAVVALARRSTALLTGVPPEVAPVSLAGWARYLTRWLRLTGYEARNVVAHLCVNHAAAETASTTAAAGEATV